MVSIDSFGEAYVMPMQRTLLEVKERLLAQHVGLPSASDIGLKVPGFTSAHLANANTWARPVKDGENPIRVPP